METSKPLIEAHVAVQLGTYFDADADLGGGLRFLSSERITDPYWNYGVGLDTDMSRLPDALQRLRQHASKLNRQPAVYVSPETRPKDLMSIVNGSVFSTEVWMTLTQAMLIPAAKPDRVSCAEVDKGPEFDRFLDVFRNAYGPAEGQSVGYSGLPEAYPASLKASQPRTGVRIMHFLMKSGRDPIAVASVFIRPPFAGLYNVGTVHGARGKGLGRTVSEVAVRAALNGGASTVFLQTEADSAVERLYSRMGFRRSFVGTMFILG